MRVLKFIVNGQKIEKDPECDFETIVMGSQNYLRAHFNLPEEWRSRPVAASFWRGGREYAVLLKDNACDVPAEVLKYPAFMISLTCLLDKQKIPTNKLLIRQEV